MCLSLAGKHHCTLPGEFQIFKGLHASSIFCFICFVNASLLPNIARYLNPSWFSLTSKTSEPWAVHGWHRGDAWAYSAHTVTFTCVQPCVLSACVWPHTCLHWPLGSNLTHSSVCSPAWSQLFGKEPHPYIYYGIPYLLFQRGQN